MHGLRNERQLMPARRWLKASMALREAAKNYVQADEEAGESQSVERGRAWEEMIAAAEEYLEASKQMNERGPAGPGPERKS